MDPQALTAALLFLAQQHRAGRLTAEQHGQLKTQLLSGDDAVRSAMVGAASGVVDLDGLLQRLHLGPAPAPSAPLEEAEVLRAPLAFLARAFSEVSQGRRAEDLCEGWGAAERVLASLSAAGGWEAVPLLASLRAEEVRSGRLVRFRGMVQDMFDPEFYVAVYEQRTAAGGRELRSGMFSDTVFGEGVDPASHKLGERQLLYCIPVPAESAWAAPKTQTPLAPMDTTAVPAAAKQSAAKRGMEAEEAAAEAPDLAAAATAEERLKRNKSQAGREAQRAPDPTLVQASFPVPTPGPVCLAKVYGSTAEFKLNEVIEVIGVLSLNPELVSFEQEEDDFLDPSSALPPSLVPRIHAVAVRHAPNTPPLSVHILRERMPVAEVRRRTVELLAGCLRGDLLAAEYLLLNLISKVHSRQATVAVGKFVLNISGAQPHLVRPLEALLRQLVPRCCYFPFTIAHMQSCNVRPRKDHKSNKLISGLLQLTEGTHLIIDETQLTTGNLNERGLQNLRALKHALEHQRVEYDFAFHQLEFDVDLPALTVSYSRAMLPADCLVPLRPAETSAAAQEAPTEGLQDVRAYLQAVRHADFTIDAEASKALEDEFIKARQEQPPAGPELLHSWLTLGRLLAASYGETTLTLGLWRRMQELEAERQRRVR